MIAGVKFTDKPEMVKEKSALQLVVCAELLKVKAASVSNNSVNNFFINKILISNVPARMTRVGRGFLVRGCCFRLDTPCFNNVA